MKLNLAEIENSISLRKMSACHPRNPRALDSLHNLFSNYKIDANKHLGFFVSIYEILLELSFNIAFVDLHSHTASFKRALLCHNDHSKSLGIG